MPRKVLNDRQLTVLRRICEGQNPVTSADGALATTVYALRSRGLVTTAWADSRWTTNPTSAGHRYLGQLDASAASSTPSTRATERDGEAATGAVEPSKQSGAAAELITDIERAGGVLRITDPSAAERLRVRRALHAARALQLVPEGHFLSYSGRDKGDLVIRMTVGEHPAHTAAHINPVPVIVDLTAEEIHPTVRDAQVSVCTECQDRTRLILHALATAAEQRGFTVGPARQESRASLAITAHGTAFPLFLAEGSIEVLDVDSVQYSWQRVTARTTQPSHQLELSIESTWAHRGRRYRWGDRQRWRLEDTLPQILREIEQRAQLDHERQLARERQKEQTRLDWQAAMDQARQKLLDANRRDVLRDQVETWHEAVRVRAYCDALEQHLVDAPAGEADTCAVREWITWARSYADRIDPLPTYPRIPPVPRASPEDLRPYLGGWSPHEPKRR